MSDNSNKLFNITVLIAVVPAYIYFCSFEYEQGFCDHFNIPTYLIAPNLTTILIFATSIWSILFSALKMLGFSTPLFRNVKNENKKHLRPVRFINGVFLVIVILMFFSYPLSWTLLWALLAFGLFLNLITWGFPLIYLFERKKTVAEKISDIQANPDKNDILNILLDTLNTKERLFILVLISIPFLSYFIGNGQALKQTSFQTLADRPNIVVIRKYDDMFICTPFDNKQKTLGDSIVLVKASDSKDLVLKTVKIGRLNTK